MNFLLICGGFVGMFLGRGDWDLTPSEFGEVAVGFVLPLPLSPWLRADFMGDLTLYRRLS